MDQEIANKLVDHSKECGSKEFVYCNDEHGNLAYKCKKCGHVVRTILQREAA